MEQFIGTQLPDFCAKPFYWQKMYPPLQRFISTEEKRQDKAVVLLADPSCAIVTNSAAMSIVSIAL